MFIANLHPPRNVRRNACGRVMALASSLCDLSAFSVTSRPLMSAEVCYSDERGPCFERRLSLADSTGQCSNRANLVAPYKHPHCLAYVLTELQLFRLVQLVAHLLLSETASLCMPVPSYAAAFARHPLDHHPTPPS